MAIADNRHRDSDNDDQDGFEDGAFGFFGRFGGGGGGVADHLVGVVGVEGLGGVAVADHARGDAQGLALGQLGLAGEAVGLGELVPERGVAPDLGRDRLQGVAGAGGVGAAGRALAVGIDRVVELIEIGVGDAGGGAVAEGARAWGGGAPGDGGLVGGVEAAVVADIAELFAAMLYYVIFKFPLSKPSKLGSDLFPVRA